MDTQHPGADDGQLHSQPRGLGFCAKRQRGVTYPSEGGNWDPSITGFLSYGFNCCGVFGAVRLSGAGAGDMQAYKPFKSSSTARPSDMVAITDSSGSINPITSATAAAWLDTVWSGNAGGSPPVSNGFNERLQTAYAKHSNRVNVVYTDGHAAPSLAERAHVGPVLWGFQCGRGSSVFTRPSTIDGAIGRFHQQLGL